MGVKYLGNGNINGVPIHDMTDSELSALSVELRNIVLASGFYTPIDDSKVERWRGRLDKPSVNKVLVVTPTLRLEPATLQRIFALEWAGPIDYFFTKDNPYSGELQYKNIELNMNKARDVLLNGGYDAMLIVESDMLPPSDGLKKLALADADVAGGLYLMRNRPMVTNVIIHRPNDWHDRSYMQLTEVGIHPELIRTNGVSCGFALVKAHVLKNISFRHVLPHSPDWEFMADCNKQGFYTACDRSVKCGHIQEDGKVLMPDY